jgi:monoamine oxidase
MSSNSDVLIIGSDLAGLCWALRLHQSGLSFQGLEASDGVRGRVKRFSPLDKLVLND